MFVQTIGPWLTSTLRGAGWAPAGVFAIHLVISNGFDAYHRYPRLDVPMHLLGGFAIAYFFHVASLRGSALGVLGEYHRATHGLLVFGMTCAAAVVWEFAENLSDYYLGTRAQCGNLQDTLMDMLLGIIGCLALLVIAGMRGQSNTAALEDSTSKRTELIHPSRDAGPATR